MTFRISEVQYYYNGLAVDLQAKSFSAGGVHWASWNAAHLFFKCLNLKGGT
jgi:hypothetical protein